jgi:hypothetical protein
MEERENIAPPIISSQASIMNVAEVQFRGPKQILAANNIPDPMALECFGPGGPVSRANDGSQPFQIALLNIAAKPDGGMINTLPGAALRSKRKQHNANHRVFDHRVTFVQQTRSQADWKDTWRTAASGGILQQDRPEKATHHGLPMAALWQ